MVKDDALNAIIGDTFIEDPAEREELVSPIIDAAIADADAEIDGYLAKRYAVPLAPAPRVINKFSKSYLSNERGKSPARDDADATAAMNKVTAMPY